MVDFALLFLKTFKFHLVRYGRKYVLMFTYDNPFLLITRDESAFLKDIVI